MIQEMVTASSVTSDTVISLGGSMPRRETPRVKRIKMGHNGQQKEPEARTSFKSVNFVWSEPHEHKNNTSEDV